MKGKITHLFISLTLIVISFFVGAFFYREYLSHPKEGISETSYRVNLSFTGNTLSVQKENPEIQIYLNGKSLEKDTTIKLEKK